MPTVQVIEVLGNGKARALQEMVFESLPRSGDFLAIRVGTTTLRFVVDGIIHEVSLGLPNRIVMRVRNIEVHQQQLRALPPPPPPPELPEPQPMRIIGNDDEWMP